ncbi:MAG TPA: response regulator [Syntrophomonadaceae bacterium]|nr:response regulator [Syntrophomonadaceae bacterium]HNX28151.1 response regulator [Syntrophomonadaceae bacterium]HPR93446.1 response regulator [Syntrophomonadaceae bacterium]
MTKKILVVDDQKGIRNLLKELLEQEGFQVITVGDGSAAIKETQEQKIDLIIMDMRMPGMNGLEAAKRILRDEYIPVILMTADAKTEVREAAREAGVNRCIIKPFAIEELRDVVLNL